MSSPEEWGVSITHIQLATAIMRYASESKIGPSLRYQSSGLSATLRDGWS